MSGRNSVKAPSAIVFAIVMLLICAVRLIICQYDIPPLRISFHNEIDQFHYTLPSLNMGQFESWHNPNYPEESFIRILFDFFQNIITSSIFLSFGLSAFTFKLGPILISLISILFFYQALRNFKIDTWICLLVTVAFSLEFSFLVSSVTQNPTIYSTFVSAVVLLLISNIAKTSKFGTQPISSSRTFLLGMAVSLGVLIVYVFTSYLAIAVTIMYLFSALMLRSNTKLIWYLGGGAISGVLLGNLVSYAFVGLTTYDLYLNLVRFQGGDELSFAAETGLIDNINTAFWALLGTNFFRFNLSLLVFVVAGLPILFWGTRQSKFIAVMTCCILISILGQLYFLPVHSQKKLTMLLPFVFAAVAMLVEQLQNERIQNLIGLKKIVAASFLLLSASMALFVWRFTTADWYLAFIQGENTPNWFNLLNLGMVILLIVVFLLRVLGFRSKLDNLILGSVLFACSIAMFTKYYVLQPELKMQRFYEISKQYEGKKITGDFPFVFQFGGGLPVCPSYVAYDMGDDNYRDTVADLITNNQVDYTLYQWAPHNKQKTLDKIFGRDVSESLPQNGDSIRIVGIGQRSIMESFELSQSVMLYMVKAN